MAELVADCPRCRAQRITFDATGDTLVGAAAGDFLEYEMFCVCKSCTHATIFIVQEEAEARDLRRNGRMIPYPPSQRAVGYRLLRHISPANLDTAPPPEELPSDIHRAFREATKCAAVGCYNAAGAMFRLCLNLATKGTKGGTLAARLEALCEEKQFSRELQELGSVVRLDGNDAAHDGSLDEEAVEDLQAFVARFLTQLYTEPARVRAAKERRQKRKSGP